MYYTSLYRLFPYLAQPAAFSGYLEGQIEFPSTYKFNLNLDEYDNL